jgi:NAD(P)-dependent dehydrogenase (short-subunit alcohol dehydrogenase family)
VDPKICLITGANAGIGKAAAIQFAQQGHRTVMACRNRQRGEAALQEVQAKSGSDAVELMTVDMSLQSSIHELADAFLAKYDRLDALIHNAAIFDITQKEAVYTEEGVELFWATNHVGPVLLTQRLMPALTASAQGRVLTVGSKGLLAKPFLKVDLADPEFRQRKFNATNAYYQSKLAQIIYTRWLAKQLQGTGVTANCIRVPAVQTDVSKYADMPAILKKLYAVKSRFALTPAQMAQVYVWAATSDELRAITGQCFDEKRKVVGVPSFARQPENIEAVMELTMRFLSF